MAGIYSFRGPRGVGESWVLIIPQGSLLPSVSKPKLNASKLGGLVLWLFPWLCSLLLADSTRGPMAASIWQDRMTGQQMMGTELLTPKQSWSRKYPPDTARSSEPEERKGRGVCEFLPASPGERIQGPSKRYHWPPALVNAGTQRFFFPATPCSMCDLNSPNRNPIRAPYIGSAEA